VSSFSGPRAMCRQYVQLVLPQTMTRGRTWHCCPRRRAAGGCPGCGFTLPMYSASRSVIALTAMESLRRDFVLSAWRGEGRGPFLILILPVTLAIWSFCSPSSIRAPSAGACSAGDGGLVPRHRCSRRQHSPRPGILTAIIHLRTANPDRGIGDCRSGFRRHFSPCRRRGAVCRHGQSAPPAIRLAGMASWCGAGADYLGQGGLLLAPPPPSTARSTIAPSWAVGPIHCAGCSGDSHCNRRR